jgi:hypothetical protein
MRLNIIVVTELAKEYSKFLATHSWNHICPPDFKNSPILPAIQKWHILEIHSLG